ncbi:MAG: TolC family protein [Prevotella sp.]|nr:TolC family protein [Prevotella sp.]
MNKKRLLLGVVCLVGLQSVCHAGRVLTVDSCRQMAMKSNKQLQVSRVRQDIAANLRKSARTKYLPHISALGTYQFTSRPISLLSEVQQQSLSSLGNTVGASLGQSMAGLSGQLLTPQTLQLLSGLGIDPAGLQQVLNGNIGQATAQLNAEGQKIVDAFDTDTRHLWAGTIMAVQPVFMGGSIVAMNRMARLNETLNQHTAEATRQTIIYTVDQAYWQVVSLRAKQQLADSYVKVLEQLDSDVSKMIAEGVATKSDGLSVSVKLNEARLTLQKVDNGLQLSRMLLCQLVGLPIDAAVTLADEDGIASTAGHTAQTVAASHTSVEARPELHALETGVKMSQQMVNILKAGNLPQVALTGGYAVMNPNVFDGFQKKFGGFWNVGVLLRVPLWNWGDVAYKVRAAKGANTIARLEMEDMREKMQLQAEQSQLQLSEADKRLQTAMNSMASAEENLRMANLGFKEGVVPTSTVMEAQTGWLQAKSAVIDAHIDCIMSQENWKKAVGQL